MTWKQLETREWNYPGSAETHTIIWDGLLPPPEHTPHAPWCLGCRIEKLERWLREQSSRAAAAEERVKVLTRYNDELLRQARDDYRKLNALTAALAEFEAIANMDAETIARLLATSPEEDVGGTNEDVVYLMDDWRYTEEKCDFAPIMSRADFERRARQEGWSFE